MAYENLRYELADGVATITLNRPDAANAIDLALARELMQVAIRCDEDRACAPCCSRRGQDVLRGRRPEVVRGAGRQVCRRCSRRSPRTSTRPPRGSRAWLRRSSSR
jgi:hypothetical protein